MYYIFLFFLTIIMDIYFFPKLIEPGVKYFLNKSLENCNTNKNIYYNLILNLSLFFIFIVVVGLILIYKKRNKLTKEDLKRKTIIEKKYILEKIRKLNIDKEKERQENAANVPKFESSFIQLHKNYYNN